LLPGRAQRAGSDAVAKKTLASCGCASLRHPGNK
jgi:hypothetical protein